MKRALTFIPWLAVVILAIVAYRYATRAHDFQARIEASDAQTTVALAAKDSFHKSIDSAAKASVAYQDSINRLSHSAMIANAQADSLRGQIALLKRPAENDSTNPNWQRLNEKNERLAASETIRAGSLGRAFDLMGVDRDTWKALAIKGDSVNATLSVALVVSQGIVHDQAKASSDKCRIVGLLPCPSRTESAIGAVVLTLVIHNNASQIGNSISNRLTGR
jgi:hypothetical protein